MIHTVFSKWTAALVLVASLCHSSTAETAPSQTDVNRWVVELGDDDYQVRKSAAERLAKGGEVARAALSSVADGIDPETRFTATG